MPKLEISRVHDAYAAGGECPLCWLADAAERRYLESFLGARAMAPESRLLTNEKGFCPEHALRLYRGHNPPGLAAMMLTHLQQQAPGLRAALAEARGRGRRETGLARLAARIAGLRDRCQVCDMLEADVHRWAFTIVYLWKHDGEFRARMGASRGFCLDHLRTVALVADGHLGRADRERFLDAVLPLAEASLQRLDAELGEFTQLFQHSTPGPGAGEQRTALARALQFLAGRLMTKE
jgi:Family of unknown function (DUF6062)